MARPIPIWQMQARAAQKRDNEMRKAEELKKVADYFEAHTNKSRHHEAWTTEDYYEKASKEAELYCQKKLKAVQLEERRKKLENLFFKENMQYQQELKNLEAQPKFYKNGSYLNKVPTATLKDINQGIVAKEEQLRKHEAELRLHHAWRLRQPELRAAESYVKQGKLKSAWMEQIIEKELQKKKEEEEIRKTLEQRDEALRQQIKLEEEKLKDKQTQMKELRESLEGQIAELSEKETVVKQLRKQEERERQILDQLQFISNEREKEHARLIAERDANIINMGLHKYKLKNKNISIIKEINLDLLMIEKLNAAVVKDCIAEKDKMLYSKRVLDAAFEVLEEHRERERQRQKSIEAMYDGEARQINEKQDKMWAKEREARATLLKEVTETLRKQIQDKIEENIHMQKMNVLEREKILNDLDSYHKEVRSRERESQLQKSQYSTITTLQTQLNALKNQQKTLKDAAERRAELKAEFEHERDVRKEIAKIQRQSQAWT